MELETWSIVYYDEKGNQCAVDWDWLFKGQWARSQKELYEVSWAPLEGLDGAAHYHLLARFGLERWQKDFPIEKVIRMSPQKLMEARRFKEILFDFPLLKVHSDTVGYHVRAEMHY